MSEMHRRETRDQNGPPEPRGFFYVRGMTEIRAIKGSAGEPIGALQSSARYAAESLGPDMEGFALVAWSNDGAHVVSWDNGNMQSALALAFVTEALRADMAMRPIADEAAEI